MLRRNTHPKAEYRIKQYLRHEITPYFLKVCVVNCHTTTVILTVHKLSIKYA